MLNRYRNYSVYCRQNLQAHTGNMDHVRAAEKLHMPVAQGGLICLAEQPLELLEDVWSIPVGMI
jgi:hypothetical protein